MAGITQNLADHGGSSGDDIVGERLINSDQIDPGHTFQVEKEKHGEDKENVRMKWSSKVEYIISLFGYTTGISDFWRFPYLVWKNGGGAFVVAFVCILIVFAIPLFFLELAVSQYSGKSIYRIWDISPFFKGIGICVGIYNLVFIFYAALTKIWIVDYMVTSFTGLPWLSCDNEWNTNSCVTKSVLNKTTQYDQISFLNKSIVNSSIPSVSRSNFMTSEEEFWQYRVLGLSSGIGELGGLQWRLLLYCFVYRIVILAACIKSVKSIGKAMYFTTVLPVILITIMWIRTLLLPGAFDGIKYFLIPDFERLLDVQVWLEALLMTFYTLSLAWGGLTEIGCHSKFNNNFLRSTMISCAGDAFSALYNSLVIFTTLGVTAAETNTTVKDVVSAGMSIGLVGYTRALSYLPVPQVWTIIFFVCVVLITMDGQIVTHEMMVSFAEETMPRIFRNRRLLILLLSLFLVVLFNIPFCTQGGPYLVQILDWYHATLPAFICGILECVVIMWIYGGDRINKNVVQMLGRGIPHLIRISAAFITPIILTILFFVTIAKYKPPKYGSYIYPSYVEVIGWSVTVFSIVPIPIFAFIQMYKLKGTIKQRLVSLLQPNRHWKAVAESQREQNTDTEKQRGWDGRRIFYFNLTGKYYKQSGDMELNHI